MIETLYKTKPPAPFEWQGESYEFTMGEETVNGQIGYFVRETHCWWDPAAKRTVRIQYTLSPRGGFAMLEEAQQRYEALKMERAKRGFVHSFSPRYHAQQRCKYVRIEVKMKSAEESTGASS